AHGGLGRIWLARDNDLGREVALKELVLGSSAQAEVQARFLSEARVTGQLEHPGIVPVYELVQRPADQQSFYTMRLFKGRTLGQAIRDYHQKRQAGPLDLRELLGAYLDVCQAVAYAHSRGVIHRDLKGQNVVLGDFGEVIVLDWGLAKVLGSAEDQAVAAPLAQGPQDHAGLTLQGAVLGTPSYMAPEQAEGRLDALDQRTDVYGLGAILYEILTGQPPFTGPDTLEVLKMVVRAAPVPPRQRMPQAPAALEAVCLKALAKKPEERFGSARELAQEVQRWLAKEPVQAFPEPWPTRARRWLGRHRTLTTSLVAAGLMATLSLTAATVLLSAAHGRERQARELAQDQRAEADFQRMQAEKNAAEANRQQQEAQRQERRARAYLQKVYEEARDTLETRKQLLGDKSPEYADSLTNLASLYFSEGQYTQAEPLYQQAMTIYKEALGDHHPRYAASLNNLATLYQAMGQSDKAEPLFHQALEITGKSRPRVLMSTAKIGPERDTREKESLYASATSMNRLARLYESKGEFRRAEQMSGQSMEIEQKLFPEDHPRGFEARINHALALAHLGNYQEAVAEAAPAEKQPGLPANSLYDLARIFALASGAAARDATLTPTRRQELAGQYAGRAVQMLTRAAQAGFFVSPDRIRDFQKEEAFAPLRSRDDFQKFWQGVERTNGPG
ncbi:MAG: serine/threonine protein kinase, partial [Planctomycetes bacterium]|nr:serine/threonine protein kinase [Planctomycetota bacterium]